MRSHLVPRRLMLTAVARWRVRAPLCLSWTGCLWMIWALSVNGCFSGCLWGLYVTVPHTANAAAAAQHQNVNVHIGILYKTHSWTINSTLGLVCTFPSGTSAIPEPWLWMSPRSYLALVNYTRPLIGRFFIPFPQGFCVWVVCNIDIQTIKWCVCVYICPGWSLFASYQIRGIIKYIFQNVSFYLFIYFCLKSVQEPPLNGNDLRTWELLRLNWIQSVFNATWWQVVL